MSVSVGVCDPEGLSTLRIARLTGEGCVTTSEIEAVSEDARPLDKAAVKQLSTLLCEIAGMHLALRRLLNEDSYDDCQAALIELHDAMDRRLMRSTELVLTGN